MDGSRDSIGCLIQIQGNVESSQTKLAKLLVEDLKR